MTSGGNRMFVGTISTAVPGSALRSADIQERLADTCINPRSAKLLRRLSKVTTIHKRHLAILDYQSALESDNAVYRSAAKQPQGPGMAQRNELFDHASEKLLSRIFARLQADQLQRVDTLVTVSCTHASSPGLERSVFRHAGIRTDIQRWNLGFMGCSAALAGMRLVHQAGARTREALVVACELSSLHFQYTDLVDQMTANLLFSDGAAAVHLSDAGGRAEILHARSYCDPTHAGQMVWTATDHGLALTLSPDLPDTLATTLPGIMSSFLKAHELCVADIDHWLVHPGGPQILDAVENSLGLPPDALILSRNILAEFGNMSSPTILFILGKLLDRAGSGLAVCAAFGPGLTTELMLLSVKP